MQKDEDRLFGRAQAAASGTLCRAAFGAGLLAAAGRDAVSALPSPPAHAVLHRQAQQHAAGAVGLQGAGAAGAAAGRGGSLSSHSHPPLPVLSRRTPVAPRSRSARVTSLTTEVGLLNGQLKSAMASLSAESGKLKVRRAPSWAQQWYAAVRAAGACSCGWHPSLPHRERAGLHQAALHCGREGVRSAGTAWWPAPRRSLRANPAPSCALPFPQVCTADLDSARNANATAQEALAACTASKGPLGDQLTACQASLKAASDGEAAARSQLATCQTDSQAAAAACTSDKAALGAACAADKKAVTDACTASLAAAEKSCTDAKAALTTACDEAKGSLQVRARWGRRGRSCFGQHSLMHAPAVCALQLAALADAHSALLNRARALQTSLDSCNTRRAALRSELSTCATAKDACIGERDACVSAKTAAEDQRDLCQTNLNDAEQHLQGACDWYGQGGLGGCNCAGSPYTYC